MENAPQETGMMRFMKSKAAAPVGLALGFAITLLMLIIQPYIGMCLFMLSGILLFIIPKLFGVHDLRVMIVFGVVFYLVATILGAFAVSQPMIKAMEDTDEFDQNGFSGITTIDNGDGTYSLTVDVGTNAGDVCKVEYGAVLSVAYKNLTIDNSATKHADIAVVGTTGTAALSVNAGQIHYYRFINETDGTKTDALIFDANISDSDVTEASVIGNLYFVGLYVMVMYFLVLVLTTWTRKSLEKTRARLEAEGRLYPQGYGRCKECGNLVLPGEICCRKCGAYIEVPEELRTKKVEFFECSECGAEVPCDATVCPKCGAKFDGEEDDTALPEPKDESPKQN